LARNVHQAHTDFQNGLEKYGLEGNQDAELLTGATVGILGYGDLGRAVKGVLQGFQNQILAHDPWLPYGLLERNGVQPVGLEQLLRESRFVFVTATITTENSKLLNAERLEWMQPGAMLILLSRAEIADFKDLQKFANSGRIRVATDVFPEEPVPQEDPIRQTKNMLLSAHRAGALTSALQQIGKLVLEDLELISRNLPPVSCKRAHLETVTQIRSKPIEKT
ncbi:MAG: dehydrogenase, partial [Deltaproteobacteria bacterium]|nr:dehydrogenase [Deltaproteobacteria bacterium]